MNLRNSKMSGVKIMRKIKEQYQEIQNGFDELIQELEQYRAKVADLKKQKLIF